jgi:hypothetical protein
MVVVEVILIIDNGNNIKMEDSGEEVTNKVND